MEWVALPYRMSDAEATLPLTWKDRVPPIGTSVSAEVMDNRLASCPFDPYKYPGV